MPLPNGYFSGKCFGMEAHGKDAILRYSIARRSIHNGDMLLFRRGDGWFSRLISVAGRSEFSHAGMAVWLDARDCKRLAKRWPGLTPGLYCCHTLEGCGGRLDRLSTLVKKQPGRILVRQPLPELLKKYDRRKAKAAILAIVGKPYGWVAIKRAALVHLPFVRVAVFRYVLPFMLDDGQNGSLPFCSMAVSRACRAGDLDPVPNLGDGFTEPSDLARSAAFVDYCTLGAKQ